MTTAEKVQPRLKERYRNEIKDSLHKQFGYGNVMQIPTVTKVVVNMGVGEAARDAKLINGAVNDLALITGQRPEIRKARKSIAQFKLREGMPIGCRVTLRRDAMYEFFDRLVATALPRIRDFRGLSPRKFDGRGNYTFGIGDQTIFPEIELDKIKRQQGMDITIVTSAPTNEEALDLLKLMGFPFAEK
jgi:large subunit ribosomal protein L5